MTNAAPLRIRVLIAENNFLTRLGIVTMLRQQPEIDVVAEAEDGIAAIELYKRLSPEVVVTDLRLPHLDGLQVISNIMALDPRARVLVLTHNTGREAVYRAVSAGARGYATKDLSGKELLAALLRVHAGEPYIPEHIQARLDERARQAKLSPREQQVLEKIYAGGRNVAIAAELGLSAKTVISYVSSLLSKRGV